jgi:hypothetical protein
MSNKRSDADDEDALADLWRRIRTEGPIVAFETSIDICRGPRSYASARATASTNLFRVAGFFKEQEQGQKELHEMTPAELNAAVKRAHRMLARASPADDETDSDDGVFG